MVFKPSSPQWRRSKSLSTPVRCIGNLGRHLVTMTSLTPPSLSFFLIVTNWLWSFRGEKFGRNGRVFNLSIFYCILLDIRTVLSVIFARSSLRLAAEKYPSCIIYWGQSQKDMEVLPNTQMDWMLYLIFIVSAKMSHRYWFKRNPDLLPMIFYFELLFDAENVQVLEPSVMMALNEMGECWWSTLGSSSECMLQDTKMS